MVVTVNFTNKGQPSSGGDFSKKSYKPNGSQRNQGQSSARQSNGHQHDGRRSNYGSGKPNNNQKRYTLRCQFCEQMGHTVKHCPKLQSKDFTVNCVTSSNGKDKTWLMDSATPHNIMGDLANLSIHNEYDGTDEVILGDGSGHASALANAICPLLASTTLKGVAAIDASSLVPIPLNCNPVGCEWVFRVKRKPDGLVD
ncbi:Retrovirus-related Pol polyprotein from transposon RE2 [Vitis vinifera]|uniref:Retrovirus-related Pol polyprotein from transposon RE2 n=1 Tax=Vitis vinifera TaxID=29760 RepID=A0A438BYI8_VITVI|nr:Retrovirus-related Pol polyprotein from transposon RE2 [Vitis vinifera]